MQEVARIKSAYDWMVELYQTEVAEAMSAGNLPAVEGLDDKRDMLERGIFVLLFGQFEKLVTECFEQARESRASNPDWTSRRGWDTPALAGQKVPFETKLALTLDRQASEHGKILTAYHRRNHCAHGGTSEPVGSIDQFVEDLYLWQSALRR